MKVNRKVGLVLSGGGIRGIGHLALIKALEDRNIHISEISGASAGALIGAMYANGLSIDTMIQFFKNTPLFKINYFSLRKPGLLDTYMYIDTLKNYLPATFSDLKIPLTVNATDLEAGKAVYFSEGELIRPVLASCSIPFVFAPMSIQKTMYADGGVVDNFPISPLENKNYFIFGSYVNNPGVVDQSKLKSAIRILTRTNVIVQHVNVIERLKRADWLIEFPLWDYGVLDTKNIDEIFNLCYGLASNELDKLLIG